MLHPTDLTVFKHKVYFTNQKFTILIERNNDVGSKIPEMSEFKDSGN